MANPITPNMGIELPTPGVTGALGVEGPGQSWLELLNTGFDKVDAHDHGAAGGAPLDLSTFTVEGDLDFMGYSAIGLYSARFINQGGVLVGVDDKFCVYFMDGDFYVNNDTGAAVRLTNGTDVAGAPGNITGLASPAAVSWNSGLGVFIFEQSSGVKAGLYTGPLSIFDGTKKVTIAAPSGLAADYGLVLPAALPATTKLLSISSAGVVGASIYTDDVSLEVNAGSIRVKDAGVTRPKLAALGQVSSGNLTASTGSATQVDVPGSEITLTGATGRPVLVMLTPSGSGASYCHANPSTTPDGIGYIELQRKVGSGGTYATVATWRGEDMSLSQVAGVISTPPVLDTPGAGDIYYKLRYYNAHTGTLAYTSMYNVMLMALEM